MNEHVLQEPAITVQDVRDHVWAEVEPFTHQRPIPLLYELYRNALKARLYYGQLLWWHVMRIDDDERLLALEHAEQPQRQGHRLLRQIVYASGGSTRARMQHWPMYVLCNLQTACEEVHVVHGVMFAEPDWIFDMIRQERDRRAYRCVRAQFARQGRLGPHIAQLIGEFVEHG